MRNRNTAFKLGTTMVVAILCGCGSDSEPSVKHLTAVADPDPQTPFFNESTMQSLNGFGDTTTGWIADLSKVVPTGTDEAASAPSKRVRSVMAVDESQLNCDSGNIRARGLDDPQNFRATITFNSCNNEGVVSNGSIGINGSIREGSLESDDLSANVSVELNNLSLRGQESATINGDLAIDVVDNAQQLMVNIAGNALTTTTNGQTNTLSNYQIAMSEIQGDSTLSLNMTLHSSQHGSITFKTDTPLTGSAFDDNPSAGKFTMTHSDGSYLIVDADNGDPETFAYTVFNGSSISSGNSPWTELAFVESL